SYRCSPGRRKGPFVTRLAKGPLLLCSRVAGCCSDQVAELAVLNAAEERLDLCLCEHQRRSFGEARVTHRHTAVRQLRYLDAVPVRAAALTLPPDQLAVRVAGHAVVDRSHQLHLPYVLGICTCIWPCICIVHVLGSCVR